MIQFFAVTCKENMKGLVKNLILNKCIFVFKVCISFFKVIPRKRGVDIIFQIYVIRLYRFVVGVNNYFSHIDYLQHLKLITLGRYRCNFSNLRDKAI